MKKIFILLLFILYWNISIYGTEGDVYSLCNKFSISAIFVGKSRQYLVYDFNPSPGNVFYIKGYPVGYGVGFFTYISNYRMYADFGDGERELRRGDSATGFKKTILCYNDMGSPFHSLVGIPADLIAAEFRREYAQKKNPLMRMIFYLKLDAGRRIDNNGDPQDSVLIQSDKITLALREGKVVVVEREDRELAAPGIRNSLPLTVPVEIFEVESKNVGFGISEMELKMVY